MSLRIVIITLGVVGLVASLGVLSGAAGVGDGGIQSSYYANGQAKETARFDEGIRNGECTRWYRDGTLKAEGEFENGRMIGNWIWMTPEGTSDPERSGTYDNGRRISG
jgi:antitoxin component YwqK of YwqJK toxin-antitoxin module